MPARRARTRPRSRTGPGRTDAARRMTRVLVINAGSSSLKVSAIEVGTREPLASAQADWGADATRATDRDAALQKALAGLPDIEFDVAAHRVVHGGTRFRTPILVDDGVLAELD